MKKIITFSLAILLGMSLMAQNAFLSTNQSDERKTVLQKRGGNKVELVKSFAKSTAATTLTTDVTIFPYLESFEGTVDGWTMIDADGDGENWNFYTAASSAQEGSSFALSYSYLNATTTALSSNNYLISPKIVLNKDVTLSYYVSSLDPSWLDSCELLLSTTGTEASDFTVVLNALEAAPATWTEKVIDLSAYNGQAVYIAWRHFSTDQYALVLDNVSIIANDANIYTVTFNANGGTGTMEDQMFVEGIPQKISKNTFTNAGYKFIGWATTATGDVVYTNEQSMTVTQNMTLFAQWEDNAIPAGYARVSLAAADVWGDGSGYQLLLDNTATLYGSIIPASGPFSTECPGENYNLFSHKIPTAADGDCATTNIVVNNTITIYVPAGTYDYCVTNPTAGDRVWIPGGESRGNDYLFEDGAEYNFTVALVGSGDVVSIEVIGGTIPVLTALRYCTDNIESAVGTGNAATLGAAISFTAEQIAPFVNKTITDIKVGIMETFTDEISATSVWIRDAITGANLVSKPATFVPGWNTITLDAPYTITNADLVIGYDITVTGGYPLGISSNTQDVSGGHIAIGATWMTLAENNLAGNLCIEGVVDGNTAISLVEMASLSIYPNPAKDMITLTASEIINSVEIVNLLGQQVAFFTTNSTIVTYNVSDLSGNVYIVKINTAKGTTSKKITVL